MKKPGKCKGPKLLSENLVKWENFWEPWFGKKSGQGGWSVNRVQEMLGKRETENGTKVGKTVEFLPKWQKLKDWRGEEEITRKEYRRLLDAFECEGLMSQRGLWNLARDKRLQDRGALPRGEGDVIREYTAMHEENFWSSLREDLVGKEDYGKKEDKNIREEVQRKGNRDGEEEGEGEKEQNVTVTVKRRCVNSVSTVRFFLQWLVGGSWDCGTRMERSVVLFVIDVLVSPSSVVTEFCDDVSVESDRECCWTAVLFFLQKSARW